MFLKLHPQSGLPLYRQMFRQLQERIASGQLPAHGQLPSVRELSAELHVNPLTVGKVYQMLEREGLVEFRRGQGTFVTGGRKALSAADQEKLIGPALDQLVGEAVQLGIDLPRLQRLMEKTYGNKHR